MRSLNLTQSQLEVVRLLVEQKIEMPQYKDLNEELNGILDALNSAEIK